MSVLPHCSPSMTICTGAGVNGTIISAPRAAFRELSADFPEMSGNRGSAIQESLIRSSARLQLPSGGREILSVMRDRDRDAYQRGRDQHGPEDDGHVAKHQAARGQPVAALRA